MNSSKTDKWIVVGLLWVVALLNYLDRQMLSTMRPSMQIDIPELQTATNFGYLMAIFLWIYGLTSPAAGIVSDWFSKKWLIVGSLFVWSLVTYAMSWATSYNQLYVLRALMGISEAIYVPASLALIAEFHDSKTRSLATGIHITGFYVGQALGGFGATVAQQFSWQFTFNLFGGFGMLYALILIFFLKTPPALPLENKEKSSFSMFKGVPILLANLSFWVIIFYFTMIGIPGWAIKNWLPTLFSENLNIDMTKAGPMATMTIAFSSLIGVIVGGIISDRWILSNIKARVYMGALGISMTIPALLLIGFGHSILTSIVAAICFGFGFGMNDANVMPIVCQFVSAKYRATAYGLMNMIGVLFGAFATGILGKYSDSNNLGSAFAMLSVLVVAAVAMQLTFLKPQSDNFTDEK